MAGTQQTTPGAAITSAVDVSRVLPQAYDLFEGLLCELLLRGSRHPSTDAQLMATELGSLPMGLYAQQFIRWEFGRVLAVVASAGPEPIAQPNLKRVWPHMRPVDSFAVFALADTVRLGLLDLVRRHPESGLARLLQERNPAWPAPLPSSSPAGRGRPKEARAQSAYVMVAHERAFRRGASDKSAARILAPSLPRQPKTESVTREVRLARRRLPPIPEEWYRALFAERIRRLARSDLLKS